MSEQYDAIVIGSGQAGGPLSTALVASGRRTALIERDHIGGTCINTGCTPTKTMYASAGITYAANSAQRYGIRVEGVSTDMRAVRERKRAMVDQFRSGSRSAILAGGVEIVKGTASFMAPHEIAIALNDGERRLTAPLIVVDVGTSPTMPPLDGLDGIGALDSTTVMELDELPDHLVILGGGYIGVEFAQIFRRLGSRVTVVQKEPRLLCQEDEDVAAAVADVLHQDEIEVLLGANARRAFRDGNGVGLTVMAGDGECDIAGSHLLVGVGRKPNTEDLCLDHAGIEVDERGFVKVDDRLRTTAEGVYATGDCAGTPPFTHMSYDDFRILKTNLIEDGDRTKTGRLVPYTVFIDPQLGRVGMSERQAREAGVDYAVARMDMSHVARALESDRTQGFMKVLVDKASKRIIGCAILGMEGGELMAMVEIAMLGKLPYMALRDAIFAHPTLAESFNNLLGSL